MRLILEALTSLCLIQFLKGDLYCSKNTTVIDCLPCSRICEKKNDTCTNNNLYACPRNCDNKTCNDVCCQSCRNDACELGENGQVKCTEGCVPGTTGICCLEPCSIECRECDQFNVSCTSCHEGMSGQYCNVGVSTQSTSWQPENTFRSEILPTTPSSPVSNPCIWCFCLTVVLAIVLIICLGLLYHIRRNYQRDSTSTETHLISPPSEVSRRRASCPYVDIKVIDRDLAPDHLLQAAMITVPPLPSVLLTTPRMWLGIEED